MSQTTPTDYTQFTEVRTTSKMGHGVFTTNFIPKGALALLTSGVRLPHQTEYTIQIGWDAHLEPNPPVKFLNHSCDPNLGAKVNAHGLPDFYARRDITPGEELTFDYAMTEFTHYPRLDPRDEFDLTCHCGTPICRSRLGYYSELPEALRQQYLNEGVISAYLLKKP